jgi:hypothetical protein
MLATLTCKKPAIARARRARAIGGELIQGLHFLFTNSKLSFVTLSWAAGTFAAGCFGALASLYVRDVLRAHASVLGMIGSMIAWEHWRARQSWPGWHGAATLRL